MLYIPGTQHFLVQNLLVNPSTLTWKMEGKMGSIKHRINGTHA